jgi:hypothetical protein
MFAVEIFHFHTHRSTNMEGGDPPKPPDKRGFLGKRGKRKFSHHLKNGQNQKDSLTQC